MIASSSRFRANHQNTTFHHMYIGAHIICVDDSGLDPTDFEGGLPVKNRQYVIRNLAHPDIHDNRLGVMLVGIIGLTNYLGWETSFLATRFRLLEEIKAENASLVDAEKTTA